MKTSIDWANFALKEIDSARASKRKRIKPWEDRFVESMRRLIRSGWKLSEDQENTLLNIHKRMTEIHRIKWY